VAIRRVAAPTLTEAGSAASVERRLREIVGVATQMAADDVPLDVPLVELGIDSAASVDLVHAVEADLPVALPAPAHLCLSPGAPIERARTPLATGAVEGATLSTSERLALSDAQRGIWFSCQMAQESAAYNIAARARIAGKLDAGALERALHFIVL